MMCARAKTTQENTDLWHAADSLSLLTESLYECWVLQPERKRDAESMKEAGLGAASAAAAAASSAPDTTPQGNAAAAAETTAASGVQVREEAVRELRVEIRNRSRLSTSVDRRVHQGGDASVGMNWWNLIE